MESTNQTPAYVLGERVFAGNVDQLRAHIAPLLATESSTRFVLDMGRVRLCDSSGLRLLLGLQRDASTAGKQLVLYRPDRILQDLLLITKLHQVFTIVETLNDQSPAPVPPPSGQ